jgi:hypothetical protein
VGGSTAEAFGFGTMMPVGHHQKSLRDFVEPRPTCTAD